MGQIAGPRDGGKILEAFGIGPDRAVRSATITMGIGEPVVITIEEYVKPFSVIGDEVQSVLKRYKLVEDKDG